MDCKSAIDILKNSYPKTTKMVNGHLEGGFDNLECELGQAITFAIDILRRNLPKKPTVLYDQNDDGIGCTCPVCKNFIFFETVKDKYCRVCGQSFDWSEVE